MYRLLVQPFYKKTKCKLIYHYPKELIMRGGRRKKGGGRRKEEEGGGGVVEEG